MTDSVGSGGSKMEIAIHHLTGQKGWHDCKYFKAGRVVFDWLEDGK